MSHYFKTSVAVAIGVFIGFSLSQHTWVQSSQAKTPQIITADEVIAQQIEVRSKEGKRLILMGASGENSASMWFFDSKGKARLNLALYGDGNATVVLNDSNEQAVGILRSVGSEMSPFMILKHAGRDRLIMGLNQSTHDPFMVHYDNNGTKKTLWGSY